MPEFYVLERTTVFPWRVRFVIFLSGQQKGRTGLHIFGIYTSENIFAVVDPLPPERKRLGVLQQIGTGLCAGQSPTEAVRSVLKEVTA